MFKKAKEYLENYRPVSLTSVPKQVMDKVILKAMSRHMEDKKATGNSQHGSAKGKSHLTNLIAFFDESTAHCFTLPLAISLPLSPAVSLQPSY